MYTSLVARWFLFSILMLLKMQICCPKQKWGKNCILILKSIVTYVQFLFTLTCRFDGFFVVTSPTKRSTHMALASTNLIDILYWPTIANDWNIPFLFAADKKVRKLLGLVLHQQWHHTQPKMEATRDVPHGSASDRCLCASVRLRMANSVSALDASRSVAGSSWYDDMTPSNSASTTATRSRSSGSDRPER